MELSMTCIKLHNRSQHYIVDSCVGIDQLILFYCIFYCDELFCCFFYELVCGNNLAFIIGLLITCYTFFKVTLY